MRAVNLIPAEQRGGASVGAGRSQGAAYAILGLMAGLAVMAVLYGLAHHQVTSRTSEAASISAQAQQAQNEAQQLAPYASFVTAQEQRTQQVAQIVDSRFDWAHVFHEFGRVIPASASLTSLSGTIAPPTATATPSPAAETTATGAGAASASSSASSSATSATPPGSIPTFTITGCAKTQAAVALLLERLHLMDGVSNVTLQSSSKTAGGSTGSGGCPANAPAYTATITFEPLPSAAALKGPAKTTVIVAGNGSGTTAVAVTKKGASSK